MSAPVKMSSKSKKLNRKPSFKGRVSDRKEINPLLLHTNYFVKSKNEIKIFIHFRQANKSSYILRRLKRFETLNFVAVSEYTNFNKNSESYNIKINLKSYQ